MQIGAAESVVKKSVDKEATEPVHINDTFRKAKRNSLVWSTVALLSMLGDPINVNGEPVERARAAVFPLGLGFDHWILVAGSVLIATYMYVGFLRSLYPVELMNSQRFRERGLTDLPEAMRDLASQIGRAHDVLRRQLSEMADTLATLAAFDKMKNEFRGNYISAVLHPNPSMKSRADKIAHWEVKGKDGQTPQIADYRNAIMQIQHEANIVGQQLQKQAHEAESRYDGMYMGAFDKPFPEIPSLTSLTRTMGELETAASELTSYHQSIDKTDQDYLNLYDIAPTSTLFTIVVLAAAYWAIDAIVVAMYIS